jgi:TolB protein
MSVKGIGAILAVVALGACEDPVRPRFTADTAPLLVTTNLNSVWRIYAVMPDGSDTRLLSGDLTTARSPTWAPNRRQFAYVQDDHAVYVANADGSNAYEIYRDPRLTINHLHWSPAIREILLGGYEVVQGSAWARTRIAVVPLTGGSVREISTDIEFTFSPTWSRTGRQIAFSGYVDGDYELHVMNADGSEVRQLTSGGDYWGGPTWSPAADVIAFVSKAVGPIEIWAVDADGGPARRVTDATGTIDTSPTWAPDGSRIAFIHGDELFSVRPDGTQPQSIPAPSSLSHIFW